MLLDIWAFPSKNVMTGNCTNCLKKHFLLQIPKKLLNDKNHMFTSHFKEFLCNLHMFTIINFKSLIRSLRRKWGKLISQLQTDLKRDCQMLEVTDFFNIL